MNVSAAKRPTGASDGCYFLQQQYKLKLKCQKKRHATPTKNLKSSKS